MPEKLKALLKKRYIGILLILPFLIFAVIFTWPLAAILFIDPLLSFFGFFFVYWRILLLYAVLGTAVALFVIYALPYGKYILHKTFVYLSLHRACKKHKHKLHVSRFSFGFSKVIREAEDIKVVTPRETYLIHLIGFVYPDKGRVQLFSDQYKIIKKPKKKKANVIIESDPIDLPEFSTNCEGKHIFMLLSTKTEFQIHKGSGIETIASNTKIRSMVFYYAEEFIPMLKR